MNERSLKGNRQADRLPQLRHKPSLSYQLALSFLAAHSADPHVTNSNRYPPHRSHRYCWRIRLLSNMGHTAAERAGRACHLQ